MEYICVYMYVFYISYDIRDDTDKIAQLFGKKDTAYDYKKAPKRGRLEDTHDFTHKKMYLKYYDDANNPQPDTV